MSKKGQCKGKPFVSSVQRRVMMVTLVKILTIVEIKKKSLKHILIDCVDVADVRPNFYNVNNLHDLFTNVAGNTKL
jgi:hypothetical protein